MRSFVWNLWKNFPRWMPLRIRQQILAASPYRCDQIAQGQPMVVMPRAAWEEGRYEIVPGAPCNLAGEDWIVSEWLKEHPEWQPETGPRD